MQVAGVSKRYGRSLPWVLADIDLTVERGAWTVIVGANGSGKSTLMKVLAGVSRPSSGTVTGRGEVGYVPERLPEQIRMTGRVYLAHMARLRGLDRLDASRRSESLAERLALDPGLDSPITALSKGNRQKVCLAQALLAPVGLLVLDEPWSGLDPVADEGLRREIAEARRAGAAVVATAHRVGAVPEADQTFVLAGGRLEPPPAPPPSQSDLVSDLVTVELRPPAGAAPAGELPGWAAAEFARPLGEARLLGELWQFTVGRDRVDGLLATALGAGWSVHRVQPGEP